MSNQESFGGYSSHPAFLNGLILQKPGSLSFLSKFTFLLTRSNECQTIIDLPGLPEVSKFPIFIAPTCRNRHITLEKITIRLFICKHRFVNNNTAIINRRGRNEIISPPTYRITIYPKETFYPKETSNFQRAKTLAEMEVFCNPSQTSRQMRRKSIPSTLPIAKKGTGTMPFQHAIIKSEFLASFHPAIEQNITSIWI